MIGRLLICLWFYFRYFNFHLSEATETERSQKKIEQFRFFRLRFRRASDSVFRFSLRSTEDGSDSDSHASEKQPISDMTPPLKHGLTLRYRLHTNPLSCLTQCKWTLTGNGNNWTWDLQTFHLFRCRKKKQWPGAVTFFKVLPKSASFALC